MIGLVRRDRRQRYREAECGAVWRAIFSPDAALVQSKNRAADSEPKPDAADCAFRRTALKFFEQDLGI
ncbi:MAG TPA: hypothetical protein VII41_03785, partial [Steroidobacteraceae bacterium]